MKKKILSVLFLLSMCGTWLVGQTAKSGSQYYLTAVHNGNRVMTVFGNWGVIGQPSTSSVRGSWKFPANGYIGDVSLFVGAEIQMPGNVLFHSVVSCPVQRPTLNRDMDPTFNDYWTFMPQEGYASSSRLNGSKNQSIAMNIDQESWPKAWPDKLTDGNDPGWPGKWNGYFGKRSSADQESFFVMDDNNDVRYNYASNNAPLNVSFKPDTTNLLRNGLGLVVRVRGLQWAQTLAQDNIFWLYEIENTSTTTYNRAIFGMLVGTYVGVSGPGSDRYAEYDDDWSFYDVNENITYTGDFPRDNSRNPFWQGPVGMVGYAFLESPGNPFDGIDNDDDAGKNVIGASLPKFKSTDFDSATVQVNDRLVSIKDDFSRAVITVPAVPFKIKTRGRDSVTIIPGTTKLTEGNVIKESGKDVISSSAYDGVDNDFDGIIDENFYLHYRQVKVDNRTNPPQVLIDVLRPVRYFDYKTLVYNPISMIDERRDDGVDNDRDWDLLYDDTGKDGIFDPLNMDQGERDGIPTEGERNFDSRDVDESDQIGLTSFMYFSNSGAEQLDIRNDEDLWKRMQPGTFSVPPTIVNNKPIAGEDGDFIYGSGFFPLLPKKTEFLSLALVYGGGNGGSREDDIVDILKHKKTVQEIYNANYQFPIAPDPAPSLTAVAGDGNVKLYWDRKSEDAIDPVLRYKDFQGYKIFKATDRTFNDAFVVTNADGIAKGFKPIYQVDVVDSILDYFYPPKDIFQGQEGFTFYMGKNSGLVHEYTDTDVMNGRTYYYAIVAYDNGDYNKGIMPSQNSWNITTDEGTGKIQNTSSNVAIATPGVKSLGYIAPGGAPLTKQNSIGTGRISFKIVDENKITGNKYSVTFNDTRDSGKMVQTTTSYSVLDSALYSETVIPGKTDTLFVFMQRRNFLPGSITLTALDGTVIPATKYVINYERGAIRAKNFKDLQSDPTNLKKYTINYRYYPVRKSSNINSSPYVKETKDTDIFDGVQLAFTNDWSINLNDTLSGFTNQNKAYLYTFSTVTIAQDPNNPALDIIPTRYPSDYDIVFNASIIDTSDDFYSSPRIPVNFTIRNRTDNKSTRFIFDDQDFDGKIGPNDNLLLFDRDAKDSLRYTWYMNFSAKSKDTVFTFTNGDTLKIRTTKPFRNGDLFSFIPAKPYLSKADTLNNLNNIRVVPNPYVVASIREAGNYGAKFGRGERKIEFQHVPADAKISIFTVRGDLIRVLRANGTIGIGTVEWDVKTEENLDVAFGVYFYAVESSVGTKTGKIAIIK